MSFESLNSDHTPASSEVFLDTSIHCSRLKGRSFSERINRVVNLFLWKGTSSYTKTEFGNVVLAQAEYYLKKLDELNSLDAVQEFIGNVLPHRLHPKKVVWSFNLLRVHGADDAECTERVRLSLKRLMKLGVAFVEESCDHPITNGTKCYWAQKGVHKRLDGRLVWQSPKCKRTHKRCVLDEFFVENMETFAQIKAVIDKLPADAKSNQLQGFSEVIGEASDDPAMLLDYRTGCLRLADAIIAVESQDYRSMFSQNTKESSVLTRVLKQVFYYLPPNPEGGVQIQSPPP